MAERKWHIYNPKYSKPPDESLYENRPIAEIERDLKAMIRITNRWRTNRPHFQATYLANCVIEHLEMEIVRAERQERGDQ